MKPIYLWITASIFFIKCGDIDSFKHDPSINEQNDILVLDTTRQVFPPGENKSGDKTLVIKGIFDSSGNVLISVEKPVLYNRVLSYPNPNQKNGRYKVVVKYVKGDSLEVYFNALVASDSKEDRPRHGFFELQIPVRTEILLIRIIEASNGRVIKVFARNDLLVR